MSFNFSAPLPTGPTAITPAAKDLQVKAVKLTFADFTTGGATSLKAVLPPDASIVGFHLWTKTQLSGNGITAANISIGVQGGSTSQFAPSQGAAFNAANTYTPLNATNIFQDLQLPLGQDIGITVTGTATTGNPTAGEMYLLITYVR